MALAPSFSPAIAQTSPELQPESFHEEFQAVDESTSKKWKYTVDQEAFQLYLGMLTDAQKAVLNQMSEEEKQSFLLQRQKILKPLFRMLTFNDLTGRAVIWGETIYLAGTSAYYRLRNRPQRNPVHELALRLAQEVRSADGETATVSDGSAVTKELVFRALRKADEYLFKAALSTSRTDFFGFSLALIGTANLVKVNSAQESSPEGVAAVKKWRLRPWGGNLGLRLRFAHMKSTGRSYISISQVLDPLKIATSYGIGGSIELEKTSGRTEALKPGLLALSEAFCLPLNITMKIGPSHYSYGLAPSVFLGFPPTPFDFFAFQNNERKEWNLISLSMEPGLIFKRPVQFAKSIELQALLSLEAPLRQLQSKAIDVAKRVRKLMPHKLRCGPFLHGGRV